MANTFLFERPDGGERTVLVHLELAGDSQHEDLGEFRELARSAGAIVVGEVTGMRRTPENRLFVGTGKADEIRELVAAEQAQLVIFNHALTPSQERNLEAFLNCRVLDRTTLILDIFAQRAVSFEGKLQVELAQLRHLSTRLVRGWTHLERQKGGIGLRGPGETQLETDRRLIGERIKVLNRRLEKVRKQRGQGRRSRRRAEVPTVSLVGYTNAGKSTLFNRLTSAHAYVEDRLFATLDPTLRRVELPGGEVAILVDTVGFIRHLPHDLVAAFRSTLEETSEASLLLHVIDAADEGHEQAVEQVQVVLAEIGADQVPQIEVFNKIDCLPGRSPSVERDLDGQVKRVWLSARSGAGVERLIEAIGCYFRQGAVRRRLTIPPSAGKLRARLFDVGIVLAETVNENGDWEMEVEFPTPEVEQRLRAEGFPDQWIR